MTAVTAGTTASQRVLSSGGTVCSIIDFERSSTSSTSAGLLESTKFWRAHSLPIGEEVPPPPSGFRLTPPPEPPLPRAGWAPLDDTEPLEVAPLPSVWAPSPELPEQASIQARIAAPGRMVGFMVACLLTTRTARLLLVRVKKERRTARDGMNHRTLTFLPAGRVSAEQGACVRLNT